MEDPAAVPIEIAHEATTAERRGRPHGKSFGALVHAVLAEIDLRVSLCEPHTDPDLYIRPITQIID